MDTDLYEDVLRGSSREEGEEGLEDGEYVYHGSFDERPRITYAQVEQNEEGKEEGEVKEERNDEEGIEMDEKKEEKEWVDTSDEESVKDREEKRWRRKTSSSSSSISSASSDYRSKRQSRRRNRRQSRSPVSRSRSRSVHSDQHKSSSSPNRSRSSSRGTYEGIDLPLDDEGCPYSCKICRHGFYCRSDLVEHEIKKHDTQTTCNICKKKSESIAKYVAHYIYRHPHKDLTCFFCSKNYGGPASELSWQKLDQYREHLKQEFIKKRMNMRENGSPIQTRNDNGHAALRGVGNCPHGPPIRCKNFPVCPGHKCIYSHGTCRFGASCNKTSCPFDHSNRPRVCMTCVNDMKEESRRRR